MCQARLGQSVEQMDLNLKVEGSTPPWVMSLSLATGLCLHREKVFSFFSLSLSVCLSLPVCLCLFALLNRTYVISPRSWVLVLIYTGHATRMQGFNLLSLWRRDSALLLCKRIPLKSLYAWPASDAPLQCKGLNLTSASVMGNGLFLLLIDFSLSTAGPLFQP